MWKVSDWHGNEYEREELFLLVMITINIFATAIV